MMKESIIKTVEIDVDMIDNDHFDITVDQQLFLCEPKRPPLSHGWALECESQKKRNLSCFFFIEYIHSLNWVGIFFFLNQISFLFFVFSQDFIYHHLL